MFRLSLWKKKLALIWWRFAWKDLISATSFTRGCYVHCTIRRKCGVWFRCFGWRIFCLSEILSSSDSFCLLFCWIVNDILSASFPEVSYLLWKLARNQSCCFTSMPMAIMRFPVGCFAWSIIPFIGICIFSIVLTSYSIFETRMFVLPSSILDRTRNRLHSFFLSRSVAFGLSSVVNENIWSPIHSVSTLKMFDLKVLNFLFMFLFWWWFYKAWKIHLSFVQCDGLIPFSTLYILHRLI